MSQCSDLQSNLSDFLDYSMSLDSPIVGDGEISKIYDFIKNTANKANEERDAAKRKVICTFSL